MTPIVPPSFSPPQRRWIRVGWIVSILAMAAQRVWSAIDGPLLRGYDDFGHVGYILYLDLYHAVPWADQGWSYFHPPLHYAIGWALLQFGSAEVLLRGLALVNGAASLAIAGLAAAVVRRSSPDRAGLALLAFISVGCLPVYLYTGGMAGNELMAALFATLGLAIFIDNEGRPRASLGRDAAAGFAIGLALLTKITAGLTLAALGAALLLRGLRSARDLAAWRRIALRGAVLAGVGIAIASPYYARNVLEFGTPFRMSRDNPHVAAIESQQPPGYRSWTDFVYVPATLLLDPDPESEHLHHSVWGSAYAQMWGDPRGERDSKYKRARSIMAALGLVPTGLFLVGAAIGLRDVRRGRRATSYVPLLATAGVSLGAFVWFAIEAPQFSALKASYLLGLTVPYAVFQVRAIEALSRLAPRAASRVAVAFILLAACAGAVANTPRLALPRLLDARPLLAALQFHLGEFDETRRLSVINLAPQFDRPIWMPADSLAAVALAEGNPARARAILMEDAPAPGEAPFRWNALGVATALAGDHARAGSLFDEAIAAGAGEVGHVNRAAVRATLGEFAAAEADLRQALVFDPALAPAWHQLAEVLTSGGRPDEAAAARARAARAARTPPRGYPYGIPGPLSQSPRSSLLPRWMLWLEDDQLLLAHAPYRAGNAIASGGHDDSTPTRPHIVLIVVDALRADHLGAYGYPRATSPNIDALAREGVRFANAAAPSSWTLPSAASLFTSRYPYEHGATKMFFEIDATVPTLTELLRWAGYRTVGVSGNFVHVSENTGFDRGFERWEAPSYDVGRGEDALWVHSRAGLRAPSAQEVNESVLTLLPPPDARPLFLYVHYMEPHAGYDPKEPHRSAFATDAAVHAAGPPATPDYIAALARGTATADAAERQRLIDLYDAEIAAVDAAIGELLDALTQRGYGGNQVVALVADHGEEFAEHQGWFHGLNLHRESLTVPLIIRDTRRADAGAVRSEPVDLLDVPTTLLERADVPAHPWMRGRALLGDRPIRARDLMATLDPDPEFEDHVARRLQRRALVRWPWKIIVDRDGSARAYQLELDPGETRPLSVDETIVPRGLLLATERLVEHASANASEAETGVVDLDPAQREGLRALGYAE